MLPSPNGQGFAMSCPHCQAGSLSLKRVLYARWHDRQFITMPNFPAWVCDVCARVEHDAGALERLAFVLGEPSAPPQPDEPRAGHGLPNPPGGQVSGSRRRIQ
jgi:YgiT-type zinc finger domain-containing protein